MAGCADAGLRDIHFVDDTFNLDPERVSRICSLLSRERLLWPRQKTHWEWT